MIKINNTANTPITVGGKPIKEVESFVYLGSTITKQGGTDEDVTSRIGKARGAFIMLRKVCVCVDAVLRLLGVFHDVLYGDY